jgi:hypothetical protein
MTTTTSGAGSAAVWAAADKPLAARIPGIIFSPRATYAGVAARPRVLGVLLFVLAVGAVAIFLFLSSDVGRNAMLDQQIESMKSFGATVTDQMIDRMEAGAGRARYFGPVMYAITTLLASLIVSGLALGVFNAILGGDSTFKQVYAVVAHSGVVLTVSQLFGLPLAYARGSMSGATNLAVFAPFLDESSFAARLLGSVDLFIIWWLVSLAIGLGVLYRKRTAPIATTLIAVYVAIGIVIAAIKTAVSGA